MEKWRAGNKWNMLGARALPLYSRQCVHREYTAWNQFLLLLLLLLSFDIYVYTYTYTIFAGEKQKDVAADAWPGCT
jgi:hypothetical protein